MNDLERDLRDVLDEDARRVPTPTSAPEGLRRSARRRQGVFGGLVGLAGAAIVAAVVAGATTGVPSGRDRSPADVGSTTTGTMNGITITYPQTWHLIDPDDSAAERVPDDGRVAAPPHRARAGADAGPETFGCPGLAAESDAAPLLMTIQEEPLAIDGPSAAPWPARSSR